MSGMSTQVSVEISPDTTTRPVLTSVSQATRPLGSSRRTASRTPSEIWSAILSGWPSVTDSEVKRNSFEDSSWVAIWKGFVLTSGGCAAARSLPGRVAIPRGAWRSAAPAVVAPAVVDHERYPLHPVALAQAILEEKAVVAGQTAAIGDVDGEARWAGLI